ncbi:MAG TPA: GNAT family N-acetyltransferase [Acidimicrobiales bacterium]
MSNPEFHVSSVAATSLHEIRRRILRGNDPNKSVIDPRDDEATSLHVAGFLDGRLIVSSSFFPSAPPMNERLVTYQLRYMATDFDAQGKGYGAIVLAAAGEMLRERGVEQLWANARDTALGFYLATGWSAVEGSEHLSPETQLPHTVIYKLLTDETYAARG